MGGIITFKLLNQFNIDQLELIKNFEFKSLSTKKDWEKYRIKFISQDTWDQEGTNQQPY